MLGDIGILLSAPFFGLIGVAAMVRPHNLLEGFGIQAMQADSRNEIRAVYGGFPLAVAGLLLFSLTRPDRSDGILIALATCSAAMAAGRVVSAVIDRRMGKAPLVWAALELVVAGLIALKLSAA